MSNSRTLLRKNTDRRRDPIRTAKSGTPNLRLKTVFTSVQHGFEWAYHATKGWRRRKL